MTKDLKIKISIDKNTGKLKVVESEFDTLNKKVKTVSKNTSSFKNDLIGLAKGVIGIYAINKAFDSVVKTGFAYNMQLEESKAGLVALSVAIKDSSIPITERYASANREATSTLTELQKINAETPHTLDQTNQIYKAMYVSMKNAGASTSDLITLTKKISIAAGAGGIQFNSLLAGVDGLATGTVLANSDLGRFLSSLGLTNKALKESKDVTKLLADKLSSFKAPDTMQVALSNLETQWDQLTGEITKTTFSNAKENVALFAGVLKEATHWTHELNIQLAASREIKYHSPIDDIKIKIKQLNDDLKDLNRGDWIGLNAFKSAEQIAGERIKLEHEIKQLERKLEQKETANKKADIAEIAEFKKQKQEANKKIEKEALKDKSKLILANINYTTEAEYNAIADRWDAEERMQDEKEANAKAFYDWQDKQIEESIKNETNLLDDAMSRVFDSGNYEFDSFGESIADSLSKEGTKAVASLAKQYTTIMSGSSGLGSIAGGVAGVGVSSALSLLSVGMQKSAESEDRLSESLDNLTKVNKDLYKASIGDGTALQDSFNLTYSLIEALSRSEKAKSDYKGSLEDYAGKAIEYYSNTALDILTLGTHRLFGNIGETIAGWFGEGDTKQNNLNAAINENTAALKEQALVIGQNIDSITDYGNNFKNLHDRLTKGTYYKDVAGQDAYKAVSEKFLNVGRRGAPSLIPQFNSLKDLLNELATTYDITDIKKFKEDLAKPIDTTGFQDAISKSNSILQRFGISGIDMADEISAATEYIIRFTDKMSNMSDTISAASLKYMQPKQVGFSGINSQISGATFDNYNNVISSIDSAYEYEKGLLTDKYNTEKDILNGQLTAVKNLITFSDSIVYQNQTEQVRLKSSGKLLDNSIKEFNRLLVDGKDTSMVMSNIKSYTKDYVEFLQGTSKTDAGYNYSLAVLENKLKKTTVNDMTTDELATSITSTIETLDSTFNNAVDFLGVMATDKLVSLNDELTRQSDLTLNMLGATTDAGDLNIAGLDNINVGILEQSDILGSLLGEDNSIVKAVGDMKSVIDGSTADETLGAIQNNSYEYYTNRLALLDTQIEAERESHNTSTDLLQELLDERAKVQQSLDDFNASSINVEIPDYSSLFTDIATAYGEFKTALGTMPTNEDSFAFVSEKFGGLQLNVEDIISSISNNITNDTSIDDLNTHLINSLIGSNSVNSNMDGMSSDLIDKLNTSDLNNEDYISSFRRILIKNDDDISSDNLASILSNARIVETSVNNASNNISTYLRTINVSILGATSAINNLTYNSSGTKGDSTSTYIRDFYTKGLGRTPDTQGFKYWNNLVDTGKIAINDLYSDMTKAAEKYDWAEINYDWIKSAPAFQTGTKSGNYLKVDLSPVVNKLNELDNRLSHIETNTYNTSTNTKTSRIA